VYAKLFTSIYQGTLRGNSRGLLVFTNLLAHADAAGHVDVHPRAIAEEVGLTVAEVRAALDELEAPDPESRSPEEDGRRLLRLDEHRAWGWRIVNYVKYRSIRSEEDRRAQNREAQKRWRDKQASDTDKQRKPRKPPSAQAEAEADTEESARVQPSAEVKPSKADFVCRAMMDVKLSAVNPGDPRLLALIDQGATVEEFTGLAAEAVSKGKWFPWVLHVLAARREEAANLKLAPVAESGPNPDIAASEARRKREAEHANASQSPEAHEARRRAMEALRKV
jgi:hypothetical protein